MRLEQGAKQKCNSSHGEQGRAQQARTSQSRSNTSFLSLSYPHTLRSRLQVPRQISIKHLPSVDVWKVKSCQGRAESCRPLWCPGSFTEHLQPQFSRSQGRITVNDVIAEVKARLCKAPKGHIKLRQVLRIQYL